MKSYNPRSLDEFITLQASLPAQTQILSGGTDWIIAHRRKAEDLPALLWIGGIPDLKRIAIDDQGQLHIGACCTMAVALRCASATIRSASCCDCSFAAWTCAKY